MPFRTPGSLQWLPEGGRSAFWQHFGLTAEGGAGRDAAVLGVQESAGEQTL